MVGIRDDFVATARVAVGLLREPAVAAGWTGPSALDGFSVGGLAGHLAYQVLALPAALDEPLPVEPVVPLLEHYARIPWVDAAPDDEINVRIRRGGEQLGAEGAAALADQAEAALDGLAVELAAAPDRPVRIPLWGPWSLRLDDLLITRTMELAVHADDLAVSVGLPTPSLPPGALDVVLDLLTRLAVRRHGAVSVLRALSRAERSPRTIAAF
jgi:hypothetical protein